MIKKLQRIGNSKGIILEKPLLALLNALDSEDVEIVAQENGLLLKKRDNTMEAYQFIAQKHRKSLDKLGQ